MTTLVYKLNLEKAVCPKCKNWLLVKGDPIQLEDRHEYWKGSDEIECDTCEWEGKINEHPKAVCVGRICICCNGKGWTGPLSPNSAKAERKLG